MMKALLTLLRFSAICSLTLTAWSQTGPFDHEEWPPTVDPTKEVHYTVLDSFADFPPPGDRWFNGDLRVQTGGDQLTRTINIGGHDGIVTTGNYLNVADDFYFDWGDNEVIDILVQFYGNSAVLGAGDEPRNFNFLTGTLPGGAGGNLNEVLGGSLPVEAKNGQWNWALFRIPNEIRPDGFRFVGETAIDAQGNFSSGGVNGGTIRFQNVPGLTVRLIAFGEEGAFGEPDQINQFAEAGACEPEPETNHVFIDVDQDISDHLVVLNDGDQTVRYENNIGPANDQRRAVIAEGFYMNFGITDNHLGLPCNEPVSIKLCVEFYDDPALFGWTFGPEAYATDGQGGIAIAPEEKKHFMEGTGEWVRRSFTLSDVNLRGVNTGSLTGGPRLIFDVVSVYFSRIEIGILRTGDHPLAGQDPLEGCYEDPFICTDQYGNYAELDLHNEVQDGLAPGSSGGDQEMIQEEAGPANDRRMAIRPAFDDSLTAFNHEYLNFAIQDEVFGPSSQPNAHLAICVTYYDDPNLVGESFRPEVYQSDRGGQVTFGFTSGDIAHVLQGTDEWREAYFEIPDLKFIGVNQGPQAAARFFFSDKIYLTRVRYGVIRPCGPFAGVNPLEECKPIEEFPELIIAWNADSSLRISWPTTIASYALQSTTALIVPDWQDVVGTQETDGATTFVDIANTETTFYRLAQ